MGSINADFEGLALLGSLETRARWQQLYDQARASMPPLREPGRVLIEVGAQHPLRGEEPGAEFAARLDRAAELFFALTSAGNSVEIYVPGSRHQHNGIPDQYPSARLGCDTSAVVELANQFSGETTSMAGTPAQGAYIVRVMNARSEQHTFVMEGLTACWQSWDRSTHLDHRIRLGAQRIIFAGNVPKGQRCDLEAALNGKIGCPMSVTYGLRRSYEPVHSVAQKN